MYKIGIIDTMNSKGIELLKSHKNFNVDIITDLSKENLLKVLPKYFIGELIVSFWLIAS